MFLFGGKPSLPNRRSSSPNNDLSDRTNRARPNQRIPDIYGRVIAVPDLLAVPYSVYENHRELEIAFLCLGRGSYEVEEIRDGETKVEQIAGAGVEVYGPGLEPGVSVPDVAIGTAIDQPVLTVAKINAVNGQTLRPPNTNFLHGDQDVTFVSPDQIVYDGDENLEDYFEADDELTVTGADFSGGGTTLVDTFTTNARFYPDGKVEFETIDPTDTYEVGDVIRISNAGFAGPDSLGETLYFDVSGDYEILDVEPTYIMVDVS
jgi:hypothetical protein